MVFRCWVLVGLLGVFLTYKSSVAIVATQPQPPAGGRAMKTAVEVLEELEVFARREGDLGKMSLGAFSDVNPFSVSNTREYGPTAGAYLSYVKVFVDGFRQFDQELHSVQMLEPTYLACVIELVRRSFDPYFVVVGPITDDDIRKIAVLLVYHYGLKMSADKSMAATA